MATYATITDIRARLPYRDIDATSTPTETQALAWLDEAEALANGCLQGGQLPAPYTSTQAKLILKSKVLDYVEGHLRNAHATAGGDGTNDDGNEKLELFQTWLDDVKLRPTMWGSILGEGAGPASARRVRSYIRGNADGKSVTDGDFEPQFTKDDLA